MDYAQLMLRLSFGSSEEQIKNFIIKSLPSFESFMVTAFFKKEHYKINLKSKVPADY